MVASGAHGGECFTVTGGPAAVRPAATRAADVVVAFGVPPGRHADIELAVHEALANALEHGHGGRGTLPLDVEVVRDGPSRVVVRVTDRALGVATAHAGQGSPHRGHGRALMQAGTDDLGIIPGSDATTVELGWYTTP